MSESVATGLVVVAVVLVLIVAWLVIRKLFRPRPVSLAERVDKVRYWNSYLTSWTETVDRDLPQFWQAAWQNQAEKDVAVERTQHALNEMMSTVGELEIAVKDLLSNSSVRDWRSVAKVAATQVHAVYEAYLIAYLYALWDADTNDRESLRKIYREELEYKSNDATRLVLETFDRQRAETYLPNLAIAVNADVHRAWIAFIDRIIEETVNSAPAQGNRT